MSLYRPSGSTIASRPGRSLAARTASRSEQSLRLHLPGFGSLALVTSKVFASAAPANPNTAAAIAAAVQPDRPRIGTSPELNERPECRPDRVARQELRAPVLRRIARVRVLVTNDDGIGAEGLQTLRRALRELDDVRVDVVAPDSNRSATARSITTRSPLWVEEIEFADGDRGFATEGTPVDCVRFADLGLLGERPDLIVSGINHGANLGDDITYSGTVAAALEGIVLGIPAIAISQQSTAREMGFRFGRSFDFGVAAALAAELVRHLTENPLPEGILLNVNCPAGEIKGIEVARLGKRLYDDELKLVEEDSEGRRRYEIYGFEPSFEDEPGTDLAAVARGKVALTPIHFDLTHHGGLGGLGEWDVDGMLDRATSSADAAGGEASARR